MSSVKATGLKSLVEMKMKFFLTILLSHCIVLVSSSLAFSAEEFDPLQSGLRMLWGLGVVLAVILAIYYLLKKNFTAFQQKEKGIIKVLEIKHILPKKTLMLVEVRGREFLVGAGNDTISTIVPLKKEGSFSTFLEKSENDISP